MHGAEEDERRGGGRRERTPSSAPTHAAPTVRTSAAGEAPNVLASRNLREERSVTTPRISRVHPLAGVEGGRVTIFGENLCTIELGQVAPQFDDAESRPLVASRDKMIVPIPDGATSGFLQVVWTDGSSRGPFFEVAQKLAGEPAHGNARRQFPDHVDREPVGKPWLSRFLRQGDCDGEIDEGKAQPVI